MPNLPEFERAYKKLEFSKEEIKKNEIYAVKLLDYKLNYYTAYHFMNFFFIHGFIFSDEVINPKLKTKEYYYNPSIDNNSKFVY